MEKEEGERKLEKIHPKIPLKPSKYAKCIKKKRATLTHPRTLSKKRLNVVTLVKSSLFPAEGGFDKKVDGRFGTFLPTWVFKKLNSSTFFLRRRSRWESDFSPTFLPSLDIFNNKSIKVMLYIMFKIYLISDFCLKLILNGVFCYNYSN